MTELSEAKEESKHSSQHSFVDPELNKSSESCDIIAQAMDSPLDRKNELSNRLRNLNPPDSQRQMVSAEFNMPADTAVEDEQEPDDDFQDYEMSFPEEYHSEEAVASV